MSRVCLLLAVAAIASAQPKIAIINLQSAIVETAEIKKAQADLEAKYKERQQAAEKLQKELQDLQTQLQAGQGKLRPEVEANMQATGQRKQKELQRLTDDLQADVDRDRQDILGQSQKRMAEVVRKLAEEKGLDAVFEQGATLYIKPALDITREASAAYDKAYPVK